MNMNIINNKKIDIYNYFNYKFIINSKCHVYKIKIKKCSNAIPINI